MNLTSGEKKRSCEGWPERPTHLRNAAKGTYPMAATLPRCPLCGLEHASDLPAFCARPGCGVELLPGTPERLKPRTFQLANHYSLCVLPFTFAEQDGQPLPQRLAQGDRWKERIFTLDNA